MPESRQMRAIPAGRMKTSQGDADPLSAVGEVSAAVESGSGLPTVARAASRALGGSLVIIDSSSSVVAVACASPADEQAVLTRAEGTDLIELRVADVRVGELRFRPRGSPPEAALVRTVTTLIALEVERSRAPMRATEAAAGTFLSDVLNRELTDRRDIAARAAELGTGALGEGGTVIVVRARPQQPAEGDWRGRVLNIAVRGARPIARDLLAAPVELFARGDGRIGTESSAPGALAAARSPAHDPELIILVPGPDAELARRAAAAAHRELDVNLTGFAFAVARSRHARDPADLHRAGAEALLAANVAEAQGTRELAFEETGSYRLLLPAMTENPGELRRFHDETMAPLAAYDEQYETELLRTLESFLEADGSVAKTAARLFTHRHTIRYRLERVRDLTGLDVSSTDGRERLSLGLKAMCVLGVHRAHGPASETGAEAGRVPRDEKDR